MSIYRVIDKLEAYVKESTALPLKHRVVSEEKVMELIEKLRAQLPEEVGRAKLIARDKDRVMREAQERAQAIVTEAGATHSQLVDNNEITKRARATAEIVLREAEERAMKIRAGADAYAETVLTDLDARLSTALGSVKKGMDALGASRSAVAAQPLAESMSRNRRAAFDAVRDDEPFDEAEIVELESVHASR